MTQPVIEGDTYDPCQTYIKLRDAYNAIMSGEGVKRVRFRNGDEERETEFNVANASDLRAAMEQAKQECMALQTPGRPTRSAIGVGRHRVPYGRRIYD